MVQARERLHAHLLSSRDKRREEEGRRQDVSYNQSYGKEPASPTRPRGAVRKHAEILKPLKIEMSIQRLEDPVAFVFGPS